MMRFLIDTPSERETRAGREEILSLEEGEHLTICTGI